MFESGLFWPASRAGLSAHSVCGAGHRDPGHSGITEAARRLHRFRGWGCLLASAALAALLATALLASLLATALLASAALLRAFRAFLASLLCCHAFLHMAGIPIELFALGRARLSYSTYIAI